MGAKHAKWFVHSAKTTGWLRETELVPKTQGVVSSIKQMKFAMSLIRKDKAGISFPPHVAKDVKESRRLYDLVKAQGRDGAMGIVQGEHALAHLAHGYDASSGRDPYDRPDAAPRPFIKGEEDGNVVGGSNEGQGSLTQADVTPGEEPTKKYASEQPGQEGEKKS
jgi:hypothetical protein